MAQNLELAKIRDFGEVITDMFVFIRQNYKSLITCFFVFCGFFLVGGAIFSAIQQTKTYGVINSQFSNFPYGSSSTRSSPFEQFGIEYFLDILFLLLNSIALHITVYSYMCLYKIKGNVAPDVAEVWGYFKYFFFKILGSGILLFLLLMVATLLCFIPGIYLYPIMALVFPIMIFENTTLGYAFNRSFRLIKENWWVTAGTLIVIWLIVYFASMVVLVPVTIMNFGGFFLHPKGGLHISSTLAITTAVLQHLCQLFYILPLIGLGLMYFNLTEKLDGTGLLERINQLGTIGPDNNSPAEEY